MEGDHKLAFDQESNAEHPLEHHSAYNPEHHPGRQEDQKYAQSVEPFPYVLPLSIIAAALIIGGASMFAGSNNTDVSGKKLTAQAADNAISGPQDFKLLETSDLALGSPDALVTIVEFADFQCPFCGRFHQTTGKDIIAQYVKTGKARLIYRDFAFLGEESNWASQAARCAGDQGKYWQYHDYLYEHQKGENNGAFAKNNLKSFALELGLNAGDFNTCLDSGKHKQDVDNDTEMGRKFGVTGTPTSFVNGKLIQGAVPFATFDLAIKAALEGK